MLASNPPVIIAIHVAMIITAPSVNNGSKIRFARCLSISFMPRWRQSMAAKKPLTTKNNGMRKP